MLHNYPNANGVHAARNRKCRHYSPYKTFITISVDNQYTLQAKVIKKRKIHLLNNCNIKTVFV